MWCCINMREAAGKRNSGGGWRVWVRLEYLPPPGNQTLAEQRVKIL